MTARDLLLNKGYLIPPDLREHSLALIQHYDVWLAEYERIKDKGELDKTFVFVGPMGYPFPTDAEAAIVGRFKQLHVELYQ